MSFTHKRLCNIRKIQLGLPLLDDRVFFRPGFTIFCMLREEECAVLLIRCGVMPISDGNLCLGELEVLKLSYLGYSVVLTLGDSDVGGTT